MRLGEDTACTGKSVGYSRCILEDAYMMSGFDSSKSSLDVKCYEIN